MPDDNAHEHQQNDAKTRDLTQGPVWRALTAMSAPMVAGIFAVLSVGVADAYFLGQLGSAPLAAVGFIYPVTAAITSLSIGLSAGANAALSQAIGRKDDETAVERLALHATAMGLASSILVAIVFWLLGDHLFQLLGAGEAAMGEIREYMPWWAVSFPFLVTMMLINAIFRAHGHGGLSAAIMVLAAIFSGGLDPVLIYGWWIFPEMGTGGAALATAIGRIVAVVVSVWIALARGYIRFDCQPAKDVLHSAREITKVGGPAAFSNAINPAGMAAVTAAVATLGETAVAGFGAATRVQSLALVPLLALSSGIGPVVGQNWGAEKQDRARRALWLCFGISVVYGLAAAGVLTALAQPIAGLLTDGGEPQDYTAQYLRIVSWSFAGYGILVTANAAVNARSKAVWSMSLSLARIGLVYLPFAWLGALTLGYSGILFAAVAANLAAIWGALVIAKSTGLLERDLPLVAAPADRLRAALG